MNKRGLFFVVMSLLFFIVGCSKVTTSTKNTTGTTKTEESIDYTHLSQAEKNEMTFKFIRNDVNGVSTVDLKVINRTSKNIDFQGTKFILLHPKGSDINSTKTGTIKINSNSTETIKNLFEEVTDDSFQTIGLYCYKNKQNRLAYSEINSNISASTNLKEDNLTKAYRNASKVVKKKETTDKDKIKKPKLPKAPAKPILNGSQAIAMVESQYGLAPNDTAYTVMKSGNEDVFGKIANENIYWVRLYRDEGTAVEYLDDWTVFQRGIVIHESPGNLVKPDQNNAPSPNDNSNPNMNDDKHNDLDPNHEQNNNVDTPNDDENNNYDESLN